MLFYKLGQLAAFEKLGYVSPEALEYAKQQYGTWYDQYGKSEGRTWDDQVLQQNAQTQQLIQEMNSVRDRYRKHTGRGVSWNMRFHPAAAAASANTAPPAALEKLGATVEDLQRHLQQEATNPYSAQVLALMRQRLGEGGTYDTMSPAMAQLIHRWDAEKIKRNGPRFTVPQAARTLGLPVPKPFQQYDEVQSVQKQAGTRVATPYEQTYQRPATSAKGGFPITDEVGSHWDAHDQRMSEKTLHGPEDTQLAT